MRIAFFSAKAFEHEPFSAAAADRHELVFLPQRLDASTAPAAAGCTGVCAFVNDRLDAPCLESLAAAGVRLVALRSAGFNHVDVDAATRLGLTVARVPAYSPHAVAEHTVALMLCLNRRIHRAYNRVREHNFALDGLMGFDLFGKTAGVVGTGKIGQCVVRIMRGFGCRVLAFDPSPCNECRELGAEYVPLAALLAESDIVTLHCPLTPATRHLINDAALRAMRPGAMLINTGRGALIDTRALIAALKSQRLGAVGLDVYEEEADLFFRDLSEEVLHDDVFARLLTFPNVLITAHQGFFTREAMANIAQTTLANADGFEAGAIDPANLVTPALFVPAKGRKG
ncbi:MAG: 2-hydroxyacid dehydrogenase [Phycisphaeraceae bacterium]|nr:2-hydroxyacid dehydrogenase [Phycisphaeraceae bacterium]MBX3406739.1 2-hydroxyacid dehydrogenase [Phycisphaeraceae bacterium]